MNESMDAMMAISGAMTDADMNTLMMQGQYAETSSTLGGLIALIQISIFLFFGYCLFILATKMKIANAWLAFIPLIQIYILVKMSGKPLWFIILWFIPIVNLYGICATLHGISKRTGHGAWWTVGLVLLGIIFIPVTAFSYQPGQGQITAQ